MNDSGAVLAFFSLDIPYCTHAAAMEDVAYPRPLQNIVGLWDFLGWCGEEDKDKSAAVQSQGSSLTSALRDIRRAFDAHAKV